MISQAEARKRVAADLLTLANRDAQAMSALAVLPHIDFAIVGFHAQQAVEKALKAVMAAHGISFPKTHNLKELHDLLLEHGHTSPLTIDQLNELTPYAVTSRTTCVQLICWITSARSLQLYKPWTGLKVQ